MAEVIGLYDLCKKSISGIRRLMQLWGINEYFATCAKCGNDEFNVLVADEGSFESIGFICTKCQSRSMVSGDKEDKS